MLAAVYDCFRQDGMIQRHAAGQRCCCQLPMIRAADDAASRGWLLPPLSPPLRGNNDAAATRYKMLIPMLSLGYAEFSPGLSCQLSASADAAAAAAAAMSDIVGLPPCRQPDGGCCYASCRHYDCCRHHVAFAAGPLSPASCHNAGTSLIRLLLPPQAAMLPLATLFAYAAMLADTLLLPHTAADVASCHVAASTHLTIRWRFRCQLAAHASCYLFSLAAAGPAQGYRLRHYTMLLAGCHYGLRHKICPRHAFRRQSQRYATPYDKRGWRWLPPLYFQGRQGLCSIEAARCTLQGLRRDASFYFWLLPIFTSLRSPGRSIARLPWPSTATPCCQRRWLPS